MPYGRILAFVGLALLLALAFDALLRAWPSPPAPYEQPWIEGKWRVVQNCNGMPIPIDVRLVPAASDDQASANENVTFHLLDHNRMQLSYNGQSDTYDILIYAQGFALRNSAGLINFCCGKWCLQAGCGGG